MTGADIQKKVGELFFPHAMAKLAELKERKIRFSHYTSAYAALQIIEKEEVWLRNAVVMNDFSEIQHGQNCIAHAWRDMAIGGVEGGRLYKLLESVQSGLTQGIADAFDRNAHDRNVQSYLVSISEHGDGTTDEDKYGRLSMWRAYGGNTNVAFVFNTTPFASESNAYNAFTSPVLYRDPDGFKSKFEEVIVGLEKEKDFLKMIGPKAVHDSLSAAFHFAALSTKHPGFSEEKEWRVIHSPTLMPSSRISSNIETINGVPQRVYKLRLENYPEDGLTGATLNELLEEILIGPTATPWPIYEALASKLEEKGVKDPWSRVKISDIPLRR